MGSSPIPTDADIDPAVFDAASLAALQALIPPDRLRAYLADLDRQLRVVVNSVVSDPALQSLAHKIVSQAGMLGLTRLSECARAIEDACRAGATPAPALRRCRAAVGDIDLYALPAVGVPPGEPPAAAI